GDPAIYRERVADILDGGWPYRDVPFEHLPVMLVPMMAAWWMGGSVSQSFYVVSFVILMSLMIVVIGWLIDVLGERLERPRPGTGWLVVTVPLLPMVLFRNDPFVVLLDVAALLSFVVGRNSWVFAA